VKHKLVQNVADIPILFCLCFHKHHPSSSSILQDLAPQSPQLLVLQFFLLFGSSKLKDRRRAEKELVGIKMPGASTIVTLQVVCLQFFACHISNKGNPSNSFYCSFGRKSGLTPNGHYLSCHRQPIFSPWRKVGGSETRVDGTCIQGVSSSSKKITSPSSS
jgi:hypothetical protein